jgi:hypothetical protein
MVSLTALWIENIEAIMTHCQSQGAKAKDLLVAVQVKEQSHTCKSKGLFGMLQNALCCQNISVTYA